MIKIVLIGCGNSGSKRCREFFGSDANIDACIAGFCDLNIERAEKLAAEFGGKAYSDYRLMFEELSPDAAVVCTPPYCTDDILLYAADAGVSFLTEVPVSSSCEKGSLVAEKVREKGITAAVHSELYYSRLMQVMRCFVNDNQIIYAEAKKITPPPAEFWKRDAELCGGILLEKGIDILTAADTLFGKIKSVNAISSCGYVVGIADYCTEDSFNAMITYSSNMTLCLSLGSYGTADSGAAFTLYSYGKRLELAGDEIRVYGDTFDPSKTKKMLHAGEVIPDEIAADCLIYRNSADKVSVRAFTDALMTENTPNHKIPCQQVSSIISFDEGLRELEIAREIKKRTVKL